MCPSPPLPSSPLLFFLKTSQMSETPITTATRFLVLASDGVWDHINNQEVVDRCKDCKDPQEVRVVRARVCVCVYKACSRSAVGGIDAALV